MRILHIDEQTGWRGGEQQASYLIRGLAARGHEAVLAGRRGSPFLTRDHGVAPVARIEAGFRGEADLVTAWRLARSIGRLGIDVVHAHTSHAHAMAWLARGMGGHAPFVLSRRTDFRPKSNRVNRWKYAAPDRIIAISSFIGRVLLDFGVQEDRLRIVHSGIDLARFDVDPLARSALGIPEDAALIGNVAALVGHKDQATLVDAMARVVRDVPKAHLVIAGEGPLREPLERQTAALGLDGVVHLPGYRQDVPSLLRALDVFAMPSKEEGLGTSVLDAMACGVPVAATAGGGIPEMVHHEETGLLSPVGNADSLAAHLVRLLRNRDEAHRFAENARRLLEERFTVDRMVEGNLRVYEEVLGEA